jgi:hypothetical protein
MRSITKLTTIFLLAAVALLANGGHHSGDHHGGPSEIPEPSTWLMMAGGVGALVWVHRRRRVNKGGDAKDN